MPLTSFVPKIWAAGDVVTPAQLNRVETAVDEVYKNQNFGVVQIDSFPGASDTAKLNNAVTYAQAQTFIPWLQLPCREFDTDTDTFQYGSGTKFLGAGLPGPARNLEISSRKLVPGVWRTRCGTGASSLLQANGTVYDTYFCGIAFHGSNSQVFRSTTNSYVTDLNGLTSYGCQHLVGNPTEKWLGTQFRLTGHWTATGHTTTQVTIGGGDADLDFYFNCNSAAGSAGRPNVIFDGLSKSSVWYPYITAEGDAIGLQIKGSANHDVSMFGGIFEGRSQTNLATRPVIDIQGGTVAMFGPDFGQASDSSGTVNGVIHQSGGDLVLFRPSYRRGSAVSAAFPLLYQTGGTASIWDARSLVSGEQVRVRFSDGVTYLAPLPANRINGAVPA